MSNEIKIRKMFWEELPKHKSGKNKGGVDWNKSIGCVVKFIYDDIVGEVEIVGYELTTKRYLTLKYNDCIWEKDILASNFKRCTIGELLCKKTKKLKIKIGTHIKDDKRDLIITNSKTVLNDRGYQKYNEKWYQYKCNKCGFDCGEHYNKGELKSEHWVIEISLLRGSGCPCCCSTPKIVVPEINSIWATDPWMIDLGVSEKDAKRYTKASNKKIVVECPDCKMNNDSVDLYHINQYRSIQCSCGDGKRYPEKFMISVLKQLNIKYKTEYTPQWSNKKRYDFYIKYKDMIIETHGEQHPGTKYHNCNGFSGYSKKAKTPEQELENDIYKEKLAKENGIKNYIAIDCSKSDMEFIKNEILNSQLAELYDLSNINWLECDKFALKNIVKEVCDYWNNKEERETTLDLVNHFKLDRSTIIKYLKKGNNLFWCRYDANEEVYKSIRKFGKNGKPVEIFKNEVSLGVFESAIDIERISKDLFGVKFNFRSISLICLNKQKQHYGYTFRYITKEEYEQRKQQSA